MAEEGNSLTRSSSTHKLFRTVSQKLRSLVPKNAGEGESHRGKCRELEPPTPLRNNKFNWLFRFSYRGEDQKRSEEYGTTEEESEETLHKSNQINCFGFERTRSSRGGSMRACFGSNTRENPESDVEGDTDMSCRYLGDQHVVLPDDILEMCLARVPYDSLVRARLVCKKWRSITTSSHFMQLREGADRKPWLFLFGLSRDGVCIGQVQALDPTLDKWHTIRADPLAGRLLYSAAAACNKIYLIGGCSARVKGDKGGFLKTHRSVLVMDVVTGNWTRAAPMRFARTTPVVGVFEVEEPGVFTVKPGVYRGYRGRQTEAHCTQKTVRKGLIVLGGQGEWNQTLYTGQIYDLVTDTWKEIAPWPQRYGSICTGVVCGRLFYGYSDTDKLATYDFELDMWSAVDVLYVPARLHDYLPKLVVCDDRVLLLGVSWAMRHDTEQAKAVRKVWKLDEGLGFKWTEVSQHPDAPLDWNAVFVGHGDKVYGVEMFKIFGQVLDFVTVCDKWRWDRVSKTRMGHDMDASSFLTKTAVVLQL